MLGGDGAPGAPGGDGAPGDGSDGMLGAGDEEGLGSDGSDEEELPELAQPADVSTRMAASTCPAISVRFWGIVLLPTIVLPLSGNGSPDPRSMNPRDLPAMQEEVQVEGRAAAASAGRRCPPAGTRASAPDAYSPRSARALTTWARLM